MNEKGEILGAVTSLFIKAVLLAARWAGTMRRMALEQFSAMSDEDKDRELLALCDRVHQLEAQAGILLKRARNRGRAPRYSLRERLWVLWHMEYYQIPRRRVEEHFGIARSTLYRWLHRIEAQASSQSAPPNKTPRDLACLVWEIARANPHWGRMRIAGQIALLNIFLSASTVRNILMRPRPNKPAAVENFTSEVIPEKATRVISARYPNHVWSVDLTTILRWGVWPVYVLVAIDHFSRKIVAACPLEGPNSAWVIDAMDAAFDRFGAPKHIITDKGSVFTGAAFAECMRARHIKPRTGAVGKHGSIAVTERAIKTLKYEWLKRVPLIKGFGHLQGLCEDFVLWYNEWRPHATAAGTPEQRYRGASAKAPSRQAKQVPACIERTTFAEARVTGFRLPRAA